MEWVTRHPQGPFVDLHDRLWILGYSPDGPEIWGIHLTSGKVIVRIPLGVPPTSDNPPSRKEKAEILREPPPGWKRIGSIQSFRWIAGTETFLLQYSKRLDIIDMDGRVVSTYECEKFCGDRVEWHPLSPTEWFAEKPDGLYRLTLP